MDLVRRVWHMVAAAWLAGWVVNAVLVWGFGLRGWGVAVAVLGAMVLGWFASAGAAKRLPDLTPEDRRDAVLGWGFFLGLVATVVCFAAPMPWALVAAVTVAGGTALARRAYARANPVD